MAQHYRSYTTKLDSGGNGSIDITPLTAAMQWNIDQISVSTKTFTANCQAVLQYNKLFLAFSPIGSIDTATGPPNVVIKPNDILTIVWVGGAANDTATITIWYDEEVAS